jgi:L,D-transpeptidase YcbB
MMGRWTLPLWMVVGVAAAAATLVLVPPRSEHSTSVNAFYAEATPASTLHAQRSVAYSEAIRRYREIAGAGGWETLAAGPAVRLGDEGPEVAALRRRLRVEGDLPAGGARDSARFDSAVDAAVRRAQRRYGLEMDGVVGPATRGALNVPARARLAQLARDRDRWAAVPAGVGRRSVLVNIPAFTLEAFRNERVVLESRVIVGRPQRPTPRISGEISSIAFSPYWNVPPGIEAMDMFPAVRTDPDYLRRNDIRVLTRGDPPREVNPATIDWRRYTAASFPYRFRQEPGGSNPMGQVKLLFPNPQNIFLHDTPDRHLFQRTDRARSSGCIRVERPLDLAAFALEGTPGWDRAAIDRAAAAGRERWARVSRPVPVRLLYLTSWMDDDGTVHFRPDIYGLDGS